MANAASGIILKDRKIFLIKRSPFTKAFPNCWACPGGKVDEKETPKQNAIREVKEEINLQFEPKELIRIGQYKDSKLYRFLGNWSGEIKTKKSEVFDCDWFTYDEAIKLKLAFDYREVIEILHEKNLL